MPPKKIQQAEKCVAHDIVQELKVKVDTFAEKLGNLNIETNRIDPKQVQDDSKELSIVKHRTESLEKANTAHAEFVLQMNTSITKLQTQENTLVDNMTKLSAAVNDVSNKTNLLALDMHKHIKPEKSEIKPFWKSVLITVTAATIIGLLFATINLAVRGVASRVTKGEPINIGSKKIDTGKSPLSN